MISGIEVNHGAGVAPDGSRIYVSNEAESTLDIADAKTFKVIKQIPLSGHPNNMAVGKDGQRVYVGIAQDPGGVDVIDTVTLKRVKTMPTKGTIHNAYVTPDGKYVVAGSIQGKTINVIDAEDRGARVDARHGPRRPPDDVQLEPGRFDQVDIRPAQRAQRVRGRRFRDT